MIKINNWSKYQSYKDRKPPWIRFHRSILDDYSFQKMSADSRALLPMLWLLACEDSDPTSGKIPYSIEEITFRLRMSYETVTDSLRELQLSDFIECNESVTEALRNRTQSVPSETETETETETENKETEPQAQPPTPKNKKRFVPPTVDEVNEYCRMNNYFVDAKKFVFFYSSKNWMVGKNKMTSWKKAVAGWNQRTIKQSQAAQLDYDIEGIDQHNPMGLHHE